MKNFDNLADFFKKLPIEEQESYLLSLLDTMYLIEKSGEKDVSEIFTFLYNLYKEVNKNAK